MVSGHFNGLMARSTRANGGTAEKMAEASSRAGTGLSTKASGSKVNIMVAASCKRPTERSLQAHLKMASF